MGEAPTSSLLTDYVGVDRQKVLGKDAAMNDDVHRSDTSTSNGNPTLDELHAYKQGHDDVVDRIREMCNPHLDQPLAAPEEAALAEIQDSFDEQQKKARVACLEAGRIDKAAYLAAMNALLADMMARDSAVLGETRFLRVFGRAGYEPDKLIDEAIFLSSP